VSKNHYIFLGITAFLVIFSFQGTRGLFETTEGRYAECAREMVETQNWLTPQLDYSPHWTKPPLTYWAIAGGMKFFGRNTWGVRFYLIPAYLLLVWATLELGRVLWDSPCGYLAGLIYAASGYAMGGAYSVNTDVLLSLWELLAVLAYWKAYRACGTAAEKRWISVMWFFTGLGFLTKGPPSLLALLVILLFHLYLRHTARNRPKIFRVWGILVFLLVGFWWYVWAVIAHPELLSYFLGQEVGQRIFSDKFHRNPEWYKPFMIYLPYVIFGVIPWFIFWPRVIKTHTEVFRFSALKKIFRDNERIAFLILWLVIPLIILSLAKSRMELYWMPFFPAAVLINARAIQRSFTEVEWKKAAPRLAAATLLVFIVVKGALAYVPLSRNMSNLYGACAAQESNDTVFLTYNKEKLHGLQFYLDGKLTRISTAGNEAWSRGSLADIMKEIRCYPKHHRYVLVLGRGDLDEVQTAAAKEELKGSVTRQGKKYYLYTIDT
jgi:4-amino-4-deoxy-L-arabinose transferase-like glycosyltransferase